MNWKMVLIVYDEALDEDILTALGGEDSPPFTKWTRVMGRGRNSEPHLLDHIWPKGNQALMSCLPEADARAALQRIRALRARLGGAGVRAFVWGVEELTE